MRKCHCTGACMVDGKQDLSLCPTFNGPGSIDWQGLRQAYGNPTDNEWAIIRKRWESA